MTPACLKYDVPAHLSAWPYEDIVADPSPVYPMAFRGIVLPGPIWFTLKLAVKKRSVLFHVCRGSDCFGGPITDFHKQLEGDRRFNKASFLPSTVLRSYLYLNLVGEVGVTCHDGDSTTCC
jgi:hypothetical protein